MYILNTNRGIEGVREAGMYSRISTRDIMTDVKWWDATLPKDRTDFDKLVEISDRLCERYVIGSEVGEGGYQHYQCRFVFEKAKELATVRNQYKEACEVGHWSKTSQQGHNFDYVQKEGKFFCSWEKALRRFSMLQLRPWQAQVEGLMQAQDERTVLVVYDPIGNHGKTYFAKYMQATHQAQYVPPMQDAQDFMAFCLEKPSKAYIFDMPRAESVAQRKGMWSAIEQIKNGYVYDKRYKFRDEWMEPPTVCVFCNELPDMAMLSTDRWYRTTITDAGKEALLMPADGWE